MVVMYRGTDESKNFAPQVTALYAAFNAIRYNRKTLVLQFAQKYPVENIMIGKQLHATQLNTQGYEVKDSGMDALLRRVSSTQLDKEAFDMCVRPCIKGNENLLDIAEISKKPDFEEEMVSRGQDIRNLIDFAKEVYDDVFIIGNGKKKSLMNTLNGMADVTIICVPQGNKDEVSALPEKYVYMVTDFDSRSSYDVKRMEKIYGVKNIALLPYNPSFKDAYNSDNVLQFVLKNSKPGKDDDNYELMHTCESVAKHMFGLELPEDEELNFPTLVHRREAEHAEKGTLTGSNVRHTKEMKGFIFKKEVTGVEINVNGFDDYMNDEEETLSDENISGPVLIYEDEADNSDDEWISDYEDTAEEEQQKLLRIRETRKVMPKKRKAAGAEQLEDYHVETSVIDNVIEPEYLVRKKKVVKKSGKIVRKDK